MSGSSARVSVTGTWVRHVPAGVGGLAVSRGGSGGRLHRPGMVALYLADSDATAWAEWYRHLAERAKAPAEELPRDLYRIAVDLREVVDLSSSAARRDAGAPVRTRPTSAQWPAFQPVGERFAAEGASAVLYASAARTRSLCLCVFEAGLPGLRVEGEPLPVIAAPPPPRGLRA
ncbi:MAG: RES family NAD+ phosphorylase [Solirubrobacteraceae bacterium]